MEHLPKVLLVPDGIQEHLQGVNHRTQPVARTDPAVPLPEAPDGSHATPHVPEGVYLWTWGTTGHTSGGSEHIPEDRG